MLSLCKVAVAVTLIVYKPRSDYVELTAVKLNLDNKSTKVSQVGKAEPSDFAITVLRLNKDDCELGEMVKYGNENVRGALKIA